MNLAAINKEITTAHSKRKKCKEIAESLSYEYRTQLALAKEKAGKTTAATFFTEYEQCRSHPPAIL